MSNKLLCKIEIAWNHEEKVISTILFVATDSTPDNVLSKRCKLDRSCIPGRGRGGGGGGGVI